MAEHDLEHLLGGFAADTLTAEEKQQLYNVALQDQQLFNALADEQALKELLTDPAVRRTLLQALKQTRTSGAGDSGSWLDWFMRPSNLALAGGLATAVFAVVLGIKVYQDSLKQAAQPAATEEAQPATPPSSAPLASRPAPPLDEKPALNAEERAAVHAPSEKEVAPATTRAKRERMTPPLPQEPKAIEPGRQRLSGPHELDTLSDHANAPTATSGTAAKKLAPAASPPVAMQAPAKAAIPGAVVPPVSARTLFYGGQSEQAATSQDRAAKPLGLRYSFVARGSDGQDREMDAATAAMSTEPVRLTLDTNQPAYLQVWAMGGSSPTKLLFPEKGSGQISTRIAPGQRQPIPVPTEHRTGTLVIRLSLVPFGPISRQEAALLDRPATGQLLESVTGPATNGQAEQATYVIGDRASSIIQIAITLPPSQ